MTVYLVGAGPGDPDLLTLKAARLLGEADVVVHDRLVSVDVMDLVAPWAQRVDVGKDPEGRRTSQGAINDVLVDLARCHATVVRLKGGDPFVFGRGGEEAEALRHAGVAVEVVPGITSALAGPAAAGIPVTHRGRSSGFTVITAHQDPRSADDLDWDAAARLGTTLVVLMGARRAGRIARRLLGAGMAATTPVAVITNATRPDQSSDHTDLVGLIDLPVRSPSVLVIGAVAAAPVLESDPAALAAQALTSDLSYVPAS